ncbi:hypothetical protein [Caballeronia sp. GAWG2-1]|uniref:hypothetical protein n=1 Tax=Caballeronia sp. GAWG2-1 TaxID=2921744 RepID=UPI0020294CE5|nr:hypothetical protein [Caballeronia sp. GAWG2-1]
MPIDFERIPPKAAVPLAPRGSLVLWGSLLVLALCIGATMVISLWRESHKTDTAWFWLCAVGYPVLIWAFLLFSTLAYSSAARASALANNRVSEDAEAACHAAASKPLTVYGYSWHYSSDKKENSLQSIVDGKVRSELRLSAAERDREVLARWIDVPGEPFYPSNELGEHTRHLAVCEWLIDQILSDLELPLSALPGKSTLHVHLCLHANLKTQPVIDRICALLKKLGKFDLRISCEDVFALFTTDAWLDQKDENTFHLVIAIELRNAISNVLGGGVAEVGVAVLLGYVSKPEAGGQPAVHLHRPVKSGVDKIADAIGLASRWSGASVQELSAVWIAGLQEDDVGLVRRSAKLDEQTQLISIESSIGDCSAASGWLALALAAASAGASPNPQLILAREDDEMTALVCRKERD